MTASTVNRLFWIGLVLLIAFDMIIGIPNRVFMAILLIGVFWALSDLNKRTESLERKSEEDTLCKRLDELNKRLRWVEHHLFGVDRDNMMSEEWSARQRVDPYEP
jgi:hypothetical protein